MKQSKSGILIACALGILASACSKPVSSIAAAQEAPVFAVNTTSAVRGQVQNYLLLSGDIIAGSTVDAYSDVAGKITRLSVSVGSYVQKGTAIATVDPSRPGQTFNPSVVRSPIAGTVIALPAAVGMTVSQQVSLARIAGGQGLEINVYVSERFISKIAIGLPCEISLDAYPGEVFRGIVTEVSPTVDPVSRTMDVKVNVDNPGTRLKSGMFAKVKIITEIKEDVVKIPSSAVIERFGQNYVFVVERSVSDTYLVRQQVVTQGILIDNVLEIKEGLRAGDEIVVRGQSLLENGSRINIVERTSPLAAN